MKVVGFQVANLIELYKVFNTFVLFDRSMKEISSILTPLKSLVQSNL